MSPEQAAGNKHVDAPTDISALAAVTHEMLAGSPPFSGTSAQVVLARILTESPPPLTQFRLGIDPRISAAVQKALAPEPVDRFPTAQAFAQALESSSAVSLPIAVPMRRATVWLAGTLAVATLAAGAWWLQESRTAASDAAPSVRVAVIPFREAGTTANASFAAGLTAALRADLATLPNVSVIAGTSIDALGDSARTPRYVARQFGASHVIGGTVQWDTTKGEVRVRVTPELVSVVEDDERTIPGQVIEDRVDDLFQTQAHVSTQIAQSLGIPLSAAAATRLASPPTRNKLAYEAYLRGQAERSDELLKQAVALDPKFARAWADLGSSLSIDYQDSPDPAIAALADTATSRALTLDPMSAQSHVARSLYYRHIKRDFDAAVREGQEGIRLAPGDAAAMHFTAASLWNSRRFDEALALARQGAALDPRRADAVARVATLLIWLRDFATASNETEKALALSHRRVSFINGNGILLSLAKGDTAGARSFFATLPDSTAQQSLGSFMVREFHVAWALTLRQRSDVIDFLRRERARHYQLGAAEHAWLQHDGPSQAAHADSAITVLREVVRRLPHEERLRIQLGYAYALAGRYREAKSQGDTAMATRSAWHDGFQGAPNSLQYAEILALAGENDHAIALVDSLLKVPGYVTPAYLAIDPYFAHLRNNARFRQLTRQ
jgi:TolB-like protein/Flp pilus assembly protein TadD